MKYTNHYSKEWLSYKEIEDILNMKDIEERHEMWILLMYAPALRVSEAINVRVKDLNFNDICVNVWGGKGRDITELQKAPCDMAILKKIKRFCDHNNLRPNDYIMFSKKAAQTSRSNVYIQVNRLCRNAGIDKKIGTHTFRRSRADYLLNKGLELHHVSKMLRHRDVRTTMDYLKISITDLQNAISKIDDEVGGLV